MKTKNILGLILLLIGITFIPKLDANANSGGPGCGPDKHVVNGRLDTHPRFNSDNEQIGWTYVIVCDVPSSMEIYCCVPLTIE